MFHAIIYDNRTSEGFTFYEKTPGFPTALLPHVEAVCNLYSEPVTDNSSVRYCPLHESTYLLSVVFRVFTSEHQQRRHFHIVNFLIGKEEALDFFSTPFCTEALVGFAQSCYTEKLHNFTGNWDAYRRRCKNTLQDNPGAPNTTPEILYSSFLAKKFQLFVGMENSCDNDINYLLNTLPYAMRPSLSFLIGMDSSLECKKTRFNFGSTSDIQRIHGNGYDGCAGTNKLTLFVRDGNITTSGVSPTQAEQELTTEILQLIGKPYYPVLRHLIRNREGLASAAQDLNSYLKHLHPLDISNAVGKAQSNNEISADVATAFKSLCGKSQKSTSFLKQVKEYFSPAPPPVRNPGRNTSSLPAAASGNPSGQSSSANLPQGTDPAYHDPSTAPNEILHVEPKDALDDLDSNTMRPRPNDPFPPAPKDPVPQRPASPDPSIPNNSKSGLGNPAPTPPRKQQPNRFPVSWLIIALLGLAVFTLVLVLGLKISATPFKEIGVFLVTVDGVVSLGSNILSYICGGITFYALARLFGHKRK